MLIFLNFSQSFQSAENIIPSQKYSFGKDLILVTKNNIGTFHFFRHIFLIKSES